MKIDVEHLCCNNLLQDFKFMKNPVKIAIDVWWNNRRKESVYKHPSLLTVFFINLKSWRRLLQPKHSTSTLLINSTNFGVFCFFNFTSYSLFYFLISFLIYIYIYIYIYILLAPLVWVFANGLGDWGFILGWVIPKTQKMLLNASLLNSTDQGEVEQSRERSSALPNTSVL